MYVVVVVVVVVEVRSPQQQTTKTVFLATLAMPKGLKSTSSPIQISASAVEPSPGVMGTEEIDLTLNALDNEVFVVTQVNIDVDIPDLPGAAGDINFTSASLSTTQRATVGSISNSNVLAAAQRAAGAGSANLAFSFDREDPLFVAQDMDYLGIVATNNMFLNIQAEGASVTNVKGARVRVYGYRAKADAATYASLVQSELLSQ